MIKSGAFTVVENNQGNILLVRRNDFPLWDLPGGQMESGEKLQETAVREFFEETGYQITVNHLAGKYFNPELEDTQYIFTGNIIGGKSITKGPETSAVKFFSPKHLPLLMIPHRKMQIKNALNFPTDCIEKEIHDLWLIKKIKNW